MPNIAQGPHFCPSSDVGREGYLLTCFAIRFARLLALPALFGTRLHVLVVGELLAGLRTLVTALRTAVGHQGALRPAPRTHLSAGGAARRAVLTLLERRQVFLLALGHQRGTVGGALIAHPLAVVARLRTRFVGGVVLVGGGDVTGAGEQEHGEAEERQTQLAHQRLLALIVRTGNRPNQIFPAILEPL